MRRALVTGANRGVGLAVARGLKAKGLDVVAGARNAGRAATEKIGCASVGLDVSERKSIDRAVAETGPFDILINNAGVLFNELMLDSPEHFAESMAVMVAGPYMLVNACAPAMQSSRLWPHRQCFFRLGQFRRRAWRPGRLRYREGRPQRSDFGALARTAGTGQDQRDVSRLGPHPHGRRRRHAVTGRRRRYGHLAGDAA